MSKAATRSGTADHKRRLRVSYIWDGTVLDDRVVRRGRAVTIGPGGGATFLTPDFDLPPRFAILKRKRKGAHLALIPGMSGELTASGEHIRVAEYLAEPEAGATPGSSRRVEVRAGDWGVIHLDGRGDHTLFFHFPEDDSKVGRGRVRDTELLWPALSLSIALFGLLIALLYPFRYEGNPYVFPGNREIIADYLVNRPDPEPVVKARAAAKSGAEDGEAKTATPTVGDPGKASGSGERERARRPSPRPSRAEPDRQLPEEIQRGLLTEQSRRAMRRASESNVLDDRLDTALDRLDERAGSAGRGRGRGRGVGDRGGSGSGTSTRGGGGTGGGGRAHADAVTRGDLDTGETRQARGTPGGEGVEEKQVRVRTGRASGDLGGLTAEEINRVVMARRNAIRACYERQLQRHPDLAGKIVLQWRIGPDGRVQRVRVRQTTVRHGPVEDCILRQVQRMKFPSPRQGATALVSSYPFIFAAR